MENETRKPGWVYNGDKVMIDGEGPFVASTSKECGGAYFNDGNKMCYPRDISKSCYNIEIIKPAHCDQPKTKWQLEAEVEAGEKAKAELARREREEAIGPGDFFKHDMGVAYCVSYNPENSHPILTDGGWRSKTKDNTVKITDPSHIAALKQIFGVEK